MTGRRRKPHPVDVAKADLARLGQSTELIESQSVTAGMCLLSVTGLVYRVAEVRPAGGRFAVDGFTDAGIPVSLELRPSPAQYALLVTEAGR